MSLERSLTRAQCQAVDRIALEEFGLPALVLMENAGRSAAEIVLETCAARGLVAPRVRVACGRGHNGGDGFVLARHLANAGSAVTCHVVCALDELRADTRSASRAAQAMNLVTSAPFAAHDADVLVDALLGTGSSGPARGPVRAWIQTLESCARERFVVALDLPSGLDADTGEPHDPTVRAALTITFGAQKTGFGSASASPYVGQVRVASIGVPEIVFERALFADGARP